MLARRGRLSQEQPQQWLHDLFLSNEKNRAQERIVTGRWEGLRKIGRAGQAAAEAVQLDFRDV
jgi:hypothetical protein